MLDRQKGDIVFECDFCGAVFETNQADFMTAVTMVRREGWKLKKDDEQWLHFCSECK